MKTFEATIAHLHVAGNGCLIDAQSDPRTKGALGDAAGWLAAATSAFSLRRTNVGRLQFARYTRSEDMILALHGAKSKVGSTEDWLDHIHRRA